MKEQLIEFQTAKLAKEKGFVFKQKETYYNPVNGFTKYEEIIPTQSLLQKWLREVHNIKIYCVPSNFVEEKWYNNITSQNPLVIGTYEHVLEIGLLEGLKLLP